jgi:ADP-heptose:LPS heptosyltransferase
LGCWRAEKPVQSSGKLRFEEGISFCKERGASIRGRNVFFGLVFVFSYKEASFLDDFLRRSKGAAQGCGGKSTRLAVPNKCLVNLSLALEEVAEEVRRCRILIGNDSGITHLAAYWGTPTAALFGPTDPKVWGPIGRRVSILQKPSLKDISVDEVRELL